MVMTGWLRAALQSAGSGKKLFEATSEELTVDPIAEKLASYNWSYAEQDPVAFAELARRVAAVGRSQAPPITYSKLVSGITFRLRSVNNGDPLNLGVPDWIDLHRAILGDFLGRLCLSTYERGAFLGSALVVSGDREHPYPSEGFRELVRALGLFTGYREDDFVLFWSSEARKAYDWYAAHEW